MIINKVKLGFAPFIDKANKEILNISATYLMNRKYTKNPEKELQKANEQMYKAIMERNFFVDMELKEIQKQEDFNL